MEHLWRNFSGLLYKPAQGGLRPGSWLHTPEVTFTRGGFKSLASAALNLMWLAWIYRIVSGAEIKFAVPIRG